MPGLRAHPRPASRSRQPGGMPASPLPVTPGAGCHPVSSPPSPDPHRHPADESRGADAAARGDGGKSGTGPPPLRAPFAGLGAHSPAWAGRALYPGPRARTADGSLTALKGASLWPMHAAEQVPGGGRGGPHTHRPARQDRAPLQRDARAALPLSSASLEPLPHFVSDSSEASDVM